MNVELLRKIEEKILGEPKSFNMRYFVMPTACGTTYCIGGWARHLAGIPPGSLYEGDPGQVELGLDEHQAARLFYVAEWPTQFVTFDGEEDEVDWDVTPEQAVARIEHFILTEGRE